MLQNGGAGMTLPERAICRQAWKTPVTAGGVVLELCADRESLPEAARRDWLLQEQGQEGPRQERQPLLQVCRPRLQDPQRGN